MTSHSSNPSQFPSAILQGPGVCVLSISHFHSSMCRAKALPPLSHFPIFLPPLLPRKKAETARRTNPSSNSLALAWKKRNTQKCSFLESNFSQFLRCWCCLLPFFLSFCSGGGKKLSWKTQVGRRRRFSTWAKPGKLKLFRCHFRPTLRRRWSCRLGPRR